MAVRFVCPSCQQPLEIDEQWAGQSVACPYCNRVVTAPAASTWPLNEQVPVASPARAEPDTLQPPNSTGELPLLRPTSVTPAWALALVLAGVGFIFVSVATWAQVASPVLTEKLGTPPPAKSSRDEQMAYQRKFIDVIQSGAIPAPKISAVAIVIGLFCSLIALVLGIKMIVQGQRRGRGIFISLIAFLCVMCQGFWTLFLSLSLTSQMIK